MSLDVFDELEKTLESSESLGPECDVKTSVLEATGEGEVVNSINFPS